MELSKHTEINFTKADEVGAVAMLGVDEYAKEAAVHLKNQEDYKKTQKQ